MKGRVLCGGLIEGVLVSFVKVFTGSWQGLDLARDYYGIWKDRKKFQDVETSPR